MAAPDATRDAPRSGDATAAGAPPARPSVEGPVGSAVEMRVPARAEYLRLIRYAAADAAARAGLSIDEIDDIRLAVSEVCSLLTGSDDPIVLRLTTDDDAVVVTGHGRPAAHMAEADRVLARSLAEAVVDELWYDDTAADRAEFRIVKRRVTV